MRSLLLAGLLAASLVAVPGAAAQGGDPIMPLSEVRQGMECTGYTVFRGTDVDTFDVEVLDVVGGEAGARLLVRVSGERIDATGVGAGFSGSPVYCPGDDGRLRNAGAISETIGEYGGKTVLATPIEAILGNPVEPPEDAQAAPANAKPLAAPISIRGLSRPVFDALNAAARRQGRTVLQAPPAPLAQPATNPFRPGSAVSVGLSSGAISVGAVGTVAYTAGDQVWSFGHEFDAAGRRALFLQSAYVAAIIGNPVQLAEGGGTYKLAGAMDDVGLVSNDAFNAVVGRVGPLPPSVPVRIFAADPTTGAETALMADVAEEIDIGNPTGASNLSFVAPLALADAAVEVIRSAPARLAGDVCLQISLRERPKPLRVCNRYVGDGTSSGTTGLNNIVALLSAGDLSEILFLIDSYKPSPLHVTEVAARVTLRRGQHQAILRRVRLPRRVRRGQRVTARVTLQRVRGAREVRRYRVTIPRGLRRGTRTLRFIGRDADTADDDLFGALTITLGDEEESATGPTSLRQLVREVERMERWDGVRFRSTRPPVDEFAPRPRGPRAFRDADLRIGGRASARVRVVG